MTAARKVRVRPRNFFPTKKAVCPKTHCFFDCPLALARPYRGWHLCPNAIPPGMPRQCAALCPANAPCALGFGQPNTLYSIDAAWRGAPVRPSNFLCANVPGRDAAAPLCRICSLRPRLPFANPVPKKLPGSGAKLSVAAASAMLNTLAYSPGRVAPCFRPHNSRISNSRQLLSAAGWSCVPQ